MIVIEVINSKLRKPVLHIRARLRINSVSGATLLFKVAIGTRGLKVCGLDRVAPIRSLEMVTHLL